MGIAAKNIKTMSKRDSHDDYKNHRRRKHVNWRPAFKEIETIGRITALDPASFLFTASENKKYWNNLRLMKDDSIQTIVLHTDTFGAAGGFGAGTWLKPGHVDIYPNNGTDQPRS